MPTAHGPYRAGDLHHPQRLHIASIGPDEAKIHRPPVQAANNPASFLATIVTASGCGAVKRCDHTTLRSASTSL
jgi:hypothetical protein